MSPNKYAKRRDGDSKRESRRAIREALQRQQQGAYMPPPREECVSEPPFEEAPSETTRLYGYLFFDGNQLVDLVMMHFVRLEDREDGWYNLARVDCAHGHVHLHFDDIGVKGQSVEHLYRLDTASDVDHSYPEAYSAIFDSWEEHERRFDGELQRSKWTRRTQRLPRTDPPQDCDAGT